MDKKPIPSPSETGRQDDVQGEGDYRAARGFQEEESAFAADDTKVNAKAREAADALDGAEGQELEKARADTAKGKTT